MVCFHGKIDWKHPGSKGTEIGLSGWVSRPVKISRTMATPAPQKQTRHPPCWRVAHQNIVPDWRASAPRREARHSNQSPSLSISITRAALRIMAALTIASVRSAVSRP